MFSSISVYSCSMWHWKIGVKLTTMQVTHILRCYSSRNILQLKDRGMWQNLFPANAAGEIKDLLNASPQCVYAGMDPTAPSLHVGNLLVLINLLHWQRGGHNVIALVGGATGRIGDPSGKNSEREKLSRDYIHNNITGIRRNLETILQNHQEHFASDLKLGKFTILNNEDFYKTMTPVDLLSTVGRHMRMGTLLSRSSVQSRLNSSVGMSLTEFSYQLFQAYDWLHLYKHYGCRFQIGGSDQMGNIMSGQELISKECDVQVYGLTLPLITTDMGDKFGKSAGNAVWLSSEHTSEFTFYQFWMRMTDADAEKMLRLFCLDKLGEIEDVIRRHKSKPEQRLAQSKLAEHVTLLVHGPEGLRHAKEAAQAMYYGDVQALGRLRSADLIELFKGAEIVHLAPEAGMDILEFAMKVGCFPSKTDAIRIISAGGLYLNQKRVQNPCEVLNPSIHRLANDVTLLRVGKRNYYIVNWI